MNYKIYFSIMSFLITFGNIAFAGTYYNVDLFGNIRSSGSLTTPRIFVDTITFRDQTIMYSTSQFVGATPSTATAVLRYITEPDSGVNVSSSLFITNGKLAVNTIDSYSDDISFSNHLLKFISELRTNNLSCTSDWLLRYFDGFNVFNRIYVRSSNSTIDFNGGLNLLGNDIPTSPSTAILQINSDSSNPLIYLRNTGTNPNILLIQKDPIYSFSNVSWTDDRWNLAISTAGQINCQEIFSNKPSLLISTSVLLNGDLNVTGTIFGLHSTTVPYRIDFSTIYVNNIVSSTTGNITMYSPIIMPPADYLYVNKLKQVSGSTITVDSNMRITGSLYLSTQTLYTGSIINSGFINTSSITISGNESIYGDLFVSGQATINSGLTVPYAGILSGAKFSVNTIQSLFNSQVNIDTTVYISSQLIVKDTITVNGGYVYNNNDITLKSNSTAHVSGNNSVGINSGDELLKISVYGSSFRNISRISTFTCYEYLQFAEDGISYGYLSGTLINTSLAGSNNPVLKRFRRDSGGTSQGVLGYAYVPGAENELYFIIKLPQDYKEGTDITPVLQWSSITTGVGGVAWGIEYTWSNPATVYPVTTQIVSTQTVTATAYYSYTKTFTPVSGTGKNILSTILCRIFRQTANIYDTFGDDAYLLEFGFYYQKDSIGSRLESIK